MTETPARDALADELARALASREAFDHFLAERGYAPAPELVAPNRATLTGTRPFAPVSPEHDGAPRLLVLWADGLTQRSLLGSKLRILQKDAVHFRQRVAVTDPIEAPDLFFLASPDFLLLFPLHGDAFARRQRFTVSQLRQSSRLAERFASLTAASMAGWALASATGAGGVAPDPDSWEALETPGRRYDFDRHLYGGGALDAEFVAFMGQERRRLLEAVLDPGLHRTALAPVLTALGPELTGPEPPETLVADARLRKHVIAVVDTVLLRLVLYRYLEAQYAGITPEERAQIGFGVAGPSEVGPRAPGTWDELVSTTADVDREGHEGLLRAAVKAASAARAGSTASATQLDLFAAPLPAASVKVHAPEAFRLGVEARSQHYQQSAGGDLHRGRLAAAADVLMRFVLSHEDLRNAFATLIEGTRSSRYSFQYEDLDPRAFQRFYEDTIGTDVSVDMVDGRPRVVPRMRNRKEQGAYFTDETVCAWLVGRTLGRWYAREWLPRLQRLLPGRRAAASPGTATTLVAHLRRLGALRIIDPTCGGGIFLRAAFEFLSRAREQVATELELGAPDSVLAMVRADEVGQMFVGDADAEPGQWEWHVLLHVLYGVDVDIKAINVASNLLTLSALTYRPRGLKFPSFINTNLKHGNALVTPLAEAGRPGFASTHAETLGRLVGRRRRLRDPNLPHAEWASLHDEVASLTRPLVETEMVGAWRDVLGGRDDPEGEALRTRLNEVGCFLYEAEFPEVFFDDAGALRPDAGFDVVVGNPPWEEPAAELKHFLPEYDADYRELSGRASQEREAALLSEPHIAARWRAFEQSVDDYKALLTRSGYTHQRRAVRGKIPGAHTNLFKYATEMAHRILRPPAEDEDGGAAGLVVDGGLWNDLAANGLRAMLLDEARLEALCGFTNNGGLFPDVHRSYKFGCVVWRRGGRTASFPAVFMQLEWSDLEHFDQRAATLDAEAIRTDPRDSYPMPEVRGPEHAAAERALSTQPVLGGPPWEVDIYSRELNAGEQRHYFHPEQATGRLPVLQGAQFNHWGVHDAELPEFWVDPSNDPTAAGAFLRAKQEGRILAAIAEHLGATKDKDRAAREWVRARTGSPDLPPEWVRLDWDAPRLAWRSIGRNDDRRTLITGIVPAHVALTDKAPFVRPFRLSVTDAGPRWVPQLTGPELLYLSGMLSSYVCDAVVRSRVAKTDVKAYLVLGLPVPPWRDTPTHRRVAELAARLTCRPATPERPWADYTALAAELGLTPERDALTDPQARRDAEVELNAHACGLYGLDRDAFRFLMTTLFDTPKHRDTHFEFRDAIAAARVGWGG
jgi:hypothetical protein